MRSSGRLYGAQRSLPGSSSDFLHLSDGLDYSHLPISQQPLSLEEKLPHVTTYPTDMLSPWMGAAGRDIDLTQDPNPNPIPIPAKGSVGDWGHAIVGEMVDLTSNRLTIDGRRQLCQGMEAAIPCAPYCNCCLALDKKSKYQNPWTDIEKVCGSYR
jgi:hypothetical protein